MGNHIVNILDNITIEQLFEKGISDDELETVMDRIKDMTLAQLMKFISLAQEKEANKVLDALMDYKDKTYPDYNGMGEFMLNW